MGRLRTIENDERRHRERTDGSPSAARSSFGAPHSLLLVALLALVSPASADGEGRSVALVVGSERYAGNALEGAVTAASALAARLEAAGVHVISLENAARRPLERARRDLAARVDGARLALLVYVGHALRLGETAYLIPTDVDLRSRSDLKRLPELQELFDLVAKADRSLVVLDACHDSSFASGWGERSYTKAPLCPGADTGFARSADTVLAWTSTDVGGGRPVVGQLASALAERLEGPSTDLLEALAGASAALSGGAPPEPNVVGAPRESWPLVEAGAPASTDAPAVGAVTLAPGRYRVTNLYRSRSLDVVGAGAVALSRETGDAAPTWYVRPLDRAGEIALDDAAGGGALRDDGAGAPHVALGPEGAATRWRLVPVPGGLPDEYQLRHLASGRWLRGDIGSGRVASSDEPGGTGWLFERIGDARPSTPKTVARADRPLGGTGGAVSGDADPARRVALTVRTTPADARVRITNIAPRYEPGILLWPNETYRLEVRHPAHGRVERDIELGENDLVLDIDLAAAAIESEIGNVPDAPNGADGITSTDTSTDTFGADLVSRIQAPTPTPTIEPSDRAIVLAKLRSVRDAIEARDTARLARLVPGGEPLERLAMLIEAYDEIDMELRHLRGSTDAERLAVDLRVVSLVDGEGDIVFPPDAFRTLTLHSERTPDGEGWSAVRWGTGDGGDVE